MGVNLAGISTKAAEFIITHNKLFEDAILNFQKTILIKSQQSFSNRYQKLTTLNTFIINKSRSLLNDHKDELVKNNQIIINNTKTLLSDKRNSLSFIASTLISKPKIIAGNKLNDLSNIFNNIISFRTSYLRNQRGYLGHFVSVINMMSPKNILKKGFAIVKFEGEVISSPDVLNTGSEIEVTLLNKSIKSKVKSKSNYNGSKFNL